MNNKLPLVSEMSYNVLMGTLNPTHSLTHSLTHSSSFHHLETFGIFRVVHLPSGDVHVQSSPARGTMVEDSYCELVTNCRERPVRHSL